MRLFATLLFVFTLLAPAGLGQTQAGARSNSSSADLARQFADPPARYRVMPFFVWNGDVTEADIDKYLADYKSQGMGGFFIHPRVGLITPYLSERWYSLFRYTVNQAKKLGLEVWIYDENPFPSGSAGGHVAAEMPESCNQGQNLTMRKLAAPEAGGACKVLLRKTGDGFEVVSGSDGSGQAGEYRCFDAPQSAGRRCYPDLLLPGVTEKFLQVTMPGYERSIGSEFGKTVPGIFSDEPNIATRGGTVRWTPDFFAQFEKRRGYDVRPHLSGMFEETGDWRKVRHDYNLTLLELFIERWSKPYYAYMEKAKLQWTGHYWEHGWPSSNDGPDNMAMYVYHRVPGIDLLFNQYDEDAGAQFGSVRIVKELSSVANQFGRERTLSETYGGSGWELRFEDMKRFGDWEYALGVNFMNQHLSYQTLAGARKYDWPQSFSYHEPWWKHYRVLNDYFGRLSLALSAGEQVNRVVILEPTTTAWMYSHSGSELGPRLQGLDRVFRSFLNRLESLQAEYDLASENIIKDSGRIENKRFAIGRRAYDVFVIPPGTENIDSPTLTLLARFLKEGGTVLSFVEPPGRVDGAVSPRARELSGQFQTQWIKAAAPDETAAAKLLLSNDFSAVTGKLYHQRRRLADGELLFFVNSSTDEPARAAVTADGRSVVRFDALTGKVSDYPAQRKGGRVEFAVELAPAGSLLLTTRRTGAPAAAKPPSGFERIIQPEGRLAAKAVSPNVLRIDYCDLKLAGSVQEDLWFNLASEKVYQKYGFRGNPWFGTQFKTEFLDKDHFPPDSGFEATYHFDVDGAVNPAKLQAVVERPSLWHVSVNGEPVTARPGAWWLDTSFGAYDIGSRVRAGKNSITLKAQPMSVHAEIQPVYILGEFGVAAQPAGFRIVPARELSSGAWKDQAMPFYSDALAYRRTYTISQPGGAYKVRLGQWLGVIAEVKVNGKSAGIIGWKPYEIDVTGMLRNGSNEVEVLVYGSLKNLLGPHLTKYRPGLVGSWLWRTAPEHTPPGSQYEVIGYGLFDDFQLVANQ